MVEELFAAVATSSGAAGVASVSVSVFTGGGLAEVVPGAAVWVAVVVSDGPAAVDPSSKGRGSSDVKSNIELTSSRSERDAE